MKRYLFLTWGITGAAVGYGFSFVILPLIGLVLLIPYFFYLFMRYGPADGGTELESFISEQISQLIWPSEVSYFSLGHIFHPRHLIFAILGAIVGIILFAFAEFRQMADDEVPVDHEPKLATQRNLTLVPIVLLLVLLVTALALLIMNRSRIGPRPRSDVHVAFVGNGGRRFATLNEDDIYIWDTKSGSQLMAINDIPRQDRRIEINNLAISPDGRFIATNGCKSVCIWNAQNGSIVSEIDDPIGGTGLIFSPDSSRLFTQPHLNMKVYNVNTGQELLALEHNGTIVSTSFSRDGQLVLTNQNFQVIRVWDSMTGEKLLELNLNIQAMDSAITPDGMQFVTAERQGNVRVWDSESGRELFKLEGHTGEVSRLDFSPDGSQLATLSEDNTSRVWDFESGEELIIIEHDQSSHSAP